LSRFTKRTASGFDGLAGIGRAGDQDAGVTLGLEFAEFREGAAEDVVGLGSGAVNRLFDGDLGIGRSGEVEFEDTAAA
jgi:hypothetical protein